MTQTIVLSNVELIFPSLTEMSKYNGESTGKFDTKFSYEIGSDNDKTVKAAIEKVKDGDSIGLGSMFTKNSMVTHDPEQYPQYANKMIGKAASKFIPAIVMKDLSPAAPTFKPWGGDKANIEITLWKQKDGKRINCWINSVQMLDVSGRDQKDQGAPKASTKFVAVTEDF